MKIKLAVSDESYDAVRSFLLDKGIELDDESDFILMQRDQYIGHLPVRNPKSGDKLYIAVEDIISIESFGHTIEVHTEKMVYTTSDRLYQLITVLDPGKFTRVSNSVIISRKKVKQINPSLSMKFVLVMVDGRKIDVTRSYYNSFREAFHI